MQIRQMYCRSSLLLVTAAWTYACHENLYHHCRLGERGSLLLTDLYAVHEWHLPVHEPTEYCFG